MEKVSIVIPVYNTEKYLVECIESALEQTYQETEVIAVNDGSTDNSLEILKKYSDRIKIISKENGGTASALNAGISVATGEWIKQLDCDDILYPDAVEVLVSETKNLSDKTNTILYASYDFIDSHGKIIGSHLEPNHNYLTEFNFNVILLDHHIGNPGTTLIHKSVFDKCGYFDEATVHEDYELRLRFCLLHHCRLQLVQKTVEKYRIHKNQNSRVNAKKREYLGKIRNNILVQINPAQREKYQSALIQYEKDRPVRQKIKKTLVRWIDENLPASTANSIRIAYHRFMLGRNYLNK